MPDGFLPSFGTHSGILEVSQTYIQQDGAYYLYAPMKLQIKKASKNLELTLKHFLNLACLLVLWGMAQYVTRLVPLGQYWES